MFRFALSALIILIAFQSRAQQVHFAPIHTNPALQHSDKQKAQQLSNRSNGYTEKIKMFRGDTLELCADTSRLDQSFNQMEHDQCVPLDYGSLSIEGHCIVFSADQVSEDREQQLCFSLSDEEGNSFTWTLYIEIRTPRSLPFVEDFYEDNYRPDPEKWLDQQVFVNNTWAKNPISIGVATFDGIDAHGQPYGGEQVYADSLTSTYIDLSDLTVGQPAYLTFWIQPGGLGGAHNFLPNVEDSLYLEFKNAEGQWMNVFSSPGIDVSAPVPPFEMQSIRIDPVYFHEQFQFRFYNHSNLEGITDLWHLDYIKLALDANPDKFERDISFTRLPPSMLEPYTSMPWKHFTGQEQQYTRDSIRIGMFGHFQQTSLADTSRFSIRETTTNTPVLTPETLLEVPPLVDSNQRNVRYGHHSYRNPIKDIDGLINSLENAFDPNAEQYTFRSNYSYQQASEVIPEWIENNSVERKTHFGNYFAYDDGTAEGGIHMTPGATGLPKIAIEFTAETGDTLRGLHLLLPHIQERDVDQQISLLIWKGDLQNEPIYMDEFISPIYPDQYFDTLSGFTTYGLESPITGNDTSLYIPPGKFYIGWQQHLPIFNEAGTYVGFDRNSPDGAKYTYFNSGNGQWNPLLEVAPSLVGSIMMRPVFGDKPQNTTDVSTPSAKPHVTIYPNPGEGVFRLQYPKSLSSPVQFQVWDQSGHSVVSGFIRDKQMDLRHLANGMYYVQLHWPKQQLVLSKKLIISKTE